MPTSSVFCFGASTVSPRAPPRTTVSADSVNATAAELSKLRSAGWRAEIDLGAACASAAAELLGDTTHDSTKTKCRGSEEVIRATKDVNRNKLRVNMR